MTNTAIKAAQSRSQSYKLFDGKGLFLSVEPSGGKLWRLKYRYDGKEKKLALGAFPETGLKEARVRRDEARKLLGAGIDPGAQRKIEKLGKAVRVANTFQAVGEEYIAKKAREGLAPVTLRKARWFLQLLAPKIGSRPIMEITPPELLAALRTVEGRGQSRDGASYEVICRKSIPLWNRHGPRGTRFVLRYLGCAHCAEGDASGGHPRPGGSRRIAARN